MKEKSFERELPEGYREVYHLSATNVKVGVIFNCIALIIMLLVIALFSLPIFSNEALMDRVEIAFFVVPLYVALPLILIYMVLHELVHGIAYKAQTGEKLKFGLSWSCAFCGVPHIYVYRKTSLIALVAPFVVFTVVLLPISIAMYYCSFVLYVAFAVVFAMHLGGCAGDIYITFLLLFKYRDNKMLMRDTGPEQFIYLHSDEEKENA